MKSEPLNLASFVWLYWIGLSSSIKVVLCSFLRAAHCLVIWVHHPFFRVGGDLIFWRHISSSRVEIRLPTENHLHRLHGRVLCGSENTEFDRPDVLTYPTCAKLWLVHRTWAAAAVPSFCERSSLQSVWSCIPYHKNFQRLFSWQSSPASPPLTSTCALEVLLVKLCKEGEDGDLLYQEYEFTYE
jgi:hypothetical protein